LKLSCNVEYMLSSRHFVGSIFRPGSYRTLTVGFICAYYKPRVGVAVDGAAPSSLTRAAIGT